MDQSPIERILSAVDRLDVDGAVATLTDDCRMMLVDGQRVAGRDHVRTVLADFFGGLRSTSHKVISEWHEGDTWIAEMEASYELRNWLLVERVPRAMFLRHTSDGVSDIRFYGAHERSIIDRGGDPDAMRIGGRWIPPL
ncbi:MAG TPA: nuclear transport factor 2 family protein [Acidimicrobiales bacterium]